MEEVTREAKIEAIVGICKYDRKLIDTLETVADELWLGKFSLDNESFGKVFQGINWTVEVLNQVMDVLNEGEDKVDKQMVNDALVAFNDAFNSGVAKNVADAIEKSLVPCLEQICTVGEKFDA